MKKYFAYLVIAVMLVASLSACGSTKTYDDDMFTSPMPTAMPSASPYASSGMDDGLDDGLVTDRDGIIEDDGELRENITDDIYSATERAKESDAKKNASPAPSTTVKPSSGNTAE